VSGSRPCPKSRFRIYEAGNCWERGCLVRIPLDAYYSHSEDNQRFFALCAECGRALRVPGNHLTDSLGKAADHHNRAGPSHNRRLLAGS
jgi:hypothetical protein